MRLRRRGRRFSAPAKSFAGAMALIATLAQFLALSHELTVQHFLCAEHGELTHVAIASVGYSLPALRSTDTLRRGETDAPGAHEHCASALTIQGSSSLSVLGGAGRVAPPPPDRPAPVLPPARDRAFVLASAPKTSPPAV